MYGTVIVYRNFYKHTLFVHIPEIQFLLIRFTVFYVPCDACYIFIAAKESLLLESQHSEALEKLRYLEDASRHTKSTTEETVITQPPK